MENKFEVVGIRRQPVREHMRRHGRGRSGDAQGGCTGALCVLTLIVLGCLLCDLLASRDPAYLDLHNCSVPPGREFLWQG